MRNFLKPYGATSNAALVAKVGHTKSPEPEVGGRRVIAVERLRKPVV